MQVLWERLAEILVAMVLAGVAMLLYVGVTSGVWQVFLVFVVPLSMLWSFILSAMTGADISKALFLLLLAATVFAVYLVARYVKQRPLRIGGAAVIFVLQQAALMNLFVAQGIIA